jgi:glycine betaine/proline transport system substrate-binding protein
VKRFQHALIAAWAAALLGGNAAMAKETIVIGDVSWEASHAVSNVLKVVIESRLDADVKIIPADQAAIFAAMDKGDGSIDVHPELWLPAQADRHAKFIAAGSKESALANDKPYTGSDGLYVPGFVQDKHVVKSVTQLTDPKIAKLFDTDGSGKGAFWPGAPGWNGVNIELVRAKSYGYDKTMKPFIVSDAVMRAELAKAFAQQKPFVLYFWEPEGLFEKYDLRKLEQPAFNGYAMDNKKGDPQYNPSGCYKMIQPQEAPDWMEKSRITCASPATTVHVAYSKSLTKRAPKVAQFLKQVSFDLPTLNEWILKVSDKVDPAALAKEWVAANPEKVNAWLAGIK